MHIQNADDMTKLVNEELIRFKSSYLRDAVAQHLVAPYLEMRHWGWTEPQGDFPVWIIADLQVRDVCIAFSKHGFGAKGFVWGLTFLSYTGFGADYWWYRTLEELAIDSGYWDEPTT